jgi:uncharacterized protein YggU (UPF0235/DUF167 family)
VILEVHVQPGARRSEFAGQHGSRVKIRLAAHYRVPKRSVRIASGLKSRDKRVVIEGL